MPLVPKEFVSTHLPEPASVFWYLLTNHTEPEGSASPALVLARSSWVLVGLQMLHCCSLVWQKPNFSRQLTGKEQLMLQLSGRNLWICLILWVLWVSQAVVLSGSRIYSSAMLPEWIDLIEAGSSGWGCQPVDGCCWYLFVCAELGLPLSGCERGNPSQNWKGSSRDVP